MDSPYLPAVPPPGLTKLALLRFCKKILLINLSALSALLDRAVEQQAGMVSPKRYIGNIAQKRKIELLEEQNEKLLKEMAALQEENNRLKKALGKRALNTIKNL